MFLFVELCHSEVCVKSQLENFKSHILASIVITVTRYLKDLSTYTCTKDLYHVSFFVKVLTLRRFDDFPLYPRLARKFEKLCFCSHYKCRYRICTALFKIYLCKKSMLCVVICRGCATQRFSFVSTVTWKIVEIGSFKIYRFSLNQFSFGMKIYLQT